MSQYLTIDTLLTKASLSPSSPVIMSSSAMSQDIIGETSPVADDMPSDIVEKIGCGDDGVIHAYYSISARPTDNVAIYTLVFYRGSFIQSARNMPIADIELGEKYAHIVPHSLVVTRGDDGKKVTSYVWE